jgi:hypothetical protein
MKTRFGWVLRLLVLAGLGIPSTVCAQENAELAQKHDDLVLSQENAEVACRDKYPTIDLDICKAAFKNYGSAILAFKRIEAEFVGGVYKTDVCKPGSEDVLKDIRQALIFANEALNLVKDHPAAAARVTDLYGKIAYLENKQKAVAAVCGKNIAPPTTPTDPIAAAASASTPTSSSPSI